MISYNFLILSSLMVFYIVRYIANNNEPVSHIAGYIIAYAVILQSNSNMLNYSNVKIAIIVGKMKAIISRLLYRKILKTYYGEISQGNSAGKLSSLVSSDLEFLDGTVMLPFFFSMPIFLLGSGVLLYFNLGVAGVIGIIIAILHVPVIVMFGKMTGKYRYMSAGIGDSRMKMITNLIEGIRIVKLYG